MIVTELLRSLNFGQNTSDSLGKPTDEPIPSPGIMAVKVTVTEPKVSVMEAGLEVTEAEVSIMEAAVDTTEDCKEWNESGGIFFFCGAGIAELLFC